MPETKLTQKGKIIVGWFDWIIATFGNLGVPEKVAVWIACQVTHETGMYTSKVAKDDLNFSGIKWINKPSIQKATKGTPSKGGFYARYASREDWARDMYRVLSSYKTKPLQATSIGNYCERLKAAGYFEDSLSNYTAALTKWENLYRGYRNAETAVKEPYKKPTGNRGEYERPPETGGGGGIVDDISRMFEGNTKWWLLGGVVVIVLAVRR